ISGPPDLPVRLEALPELRAFYRKRTVEAGGGIVEVDVVSLAGLRGVRAICKFPQQPEGMSYNGSLVLPFARFSYVLKVQCPEEGITALRDTLILSTLMPQDRDPQRWVEEEWAQDPYDASDRSRIRRNLSEDEQYDAEFPDHPLSRTRRHLAALLRSLDAEPSLREAPPFMGG
ncbi:MAG TPA: hypothetical protein VF815_26135, partial [Myxococcaceae bacterium]